MTPELVADDSREHFECKEDDDELLQMKRDDEIDEIRNSMQGAVRTSNSGQVPSTDDIDNLSKRAEYINQRFIAAADSCEPLASIEDMREYVQSADKSSNMKTEQEFWNASEQLVQDGAWGGPEGMEFNPVLSKEIGPG